MPSILHSLLPFRQLAYQTELTPIQIGQRLTENVITGFSLYSRTPYYGSFTPYSFSVRRTSSSIKKQSVYPRVEGTYRAENGHTLVTLSLWPHPFLIGVLLFLGVPILLLIGFSLSEVLITGDITPLLNGLVPAAILYGGFRLLFEVQSRADILFWEYTLHLRPGQL